MGFTRQGNIWVPSSVQYASPASTMDGLYNEAVETVHKALGGKGGTVRPHQVLPWNASLGLYDGIRNPEAATGRSFAFLRRMGSVGLPRAVLDAIVSQIVAYTSPSRSPKDIGFRITTRDKDEKTTAGDQKRMDEIRDLLLHGGVRSERSVDGEMGVWDGAQEEEADPFPVFIEKLVRDSVTLDWTAFRVEPGRNERKQPVAFFKALDAARVRLVEQKSRPVQYLDETVSAYGDVPGKGYVPKLRHGIRVEAVELDDNGNVFNEYPRSEIRTWVRNHRTDLIASGYGWPELASLVEIVAGIVTAIDHNVKYFTHNRIPPGLVVATGGFDQEWLEDFLYTMSQPGVDGNNQYKLPFLLGDETAKLQYTPFRNSEKMDMYWRNWLTFLIANMCALFRIAAEELNFQSFLTQGGQQTGTAGAERVATMRSTGIRTILVRLESVLDGLVAPFHADSTGIGPYAFEFTNIVPRDEQQERQAEQQDLQAGLASVNEIRARRDQKPLRDPKDPELWKKVLAAVEQHAPKQILAKDAQKDALCEQVYEEQGGEWHLWPDAPGGGMVQSIWQQEHEQDLSPQEDPEQQWLGAQQGGPPETFMQDMQRQQFMAQQRAMQQAQGDGEDDDMNATKEDAADDSEAHGGFQRFGKALKSLWGRVTGTGSRTYEVYRRE